MRPDRLNWLVVIGCLMASCDTPYTPAPTDEEETFTASHDFQGGPRIVYDTPITISWSEITLENFERYTVHRSTLRGGQDSWEQRGEGTNPLQISFSDALDDDVTFRYKVRIEDTNGNYREAETDRIVLHTTSIIAPDEYESLQEAYDSPFIDDGDTIYANPGVYPGTLEFLKKDVTIAGVEGADNTIIHRPRRGQRRVLVFMDRGHLTGFTVQEGYGVNLTGTAVMSHCIIKNNQATDPNHSAVVVGETAEVRHCVIAKNQKRDVFGSGGNGGGMIVRDMAIVRNCRISRNRASLVGGGMVIEGQPSILNCIIDRNYAGAGGGGLYLAEAASPTLVNCVVYGNESGLVAGRNGAVMAVRASLNIFNSIVWDNSSSESRSTIWSRASYCDIQNYDRGTGNISSAPGFADPSLSDFHLLSGSPCIDAGNPEDEYRDADGSLNDMGAYGGPYGDW